ncbi:MAG: hypothetical protein KJO07_14680 [Deltaproteobacteria bacterium]|nr:hypothetical protein [Deltaproteobacteria bacterium]
MRALVTSMVALVVVLCGGTADARPSGKALDRAEARVRKLLRSRGAAHRFHLVRRSPFVVIGDDSPARVKRRTERTVSFSIERLKRLFDWKDPDRVLEIWLFKNERSYRKHTRLLLGDDPETPFGYYSPGRRALVMNIGTGGGTLIHELVHPYIEHNFPGCPDWFNEGLGSLFEASEYRGPLIRGLTNWRLPGLKQAIRKGSLPSFRKLSKTTTAQFYGDDSGTNYAQARYLLYYLQERGLLVRYYKDFVRTRRADPTGYSALVRVLGADGRDMARFQKSWEKWVLRLRWR